VRALRTRQKIGSGHFHRENWGKVYIWRAVNWVIVGINYIISNQQRLLWRQKIRKLAIYDDA